MADLIFLCDSKAKILLNFTVPNDHHGVEPMGSTAFRLAWLSLWKLQRESRLREPRLNRIIGHGLVHKTATLYAHEHEVSAP